MQQITINLKDDKQLITEYKSVELIHYTDNNNMVKSVSVSLANDSGILTVIMNANTPTMSLKRQSQKVSTYESNQETLEVRSIELKGRVFGTGDSGSDLNSFVKLFTTQESVKQEFLKSNNRASDITLNQDGTLKSLVDGKGHKIELTKSAELMIPAFTNQLAKNGINVELLTESQAKEFTASLTDFVKSTGDTRKQRTILNKFVKRIKSQS